MAFAPASPLTGSAASLLTTPTYTLTSMPGPHVHSEQYAVTALGGTQTGVDIHGVSSPFTLTMEVPSSYKQLGVANPVTGVIPNVPINVYKVRTRKGLDVADGQQVRIGSVETIIRVPAGADTNDSVSLSAMLSCHFGALWGDSNGIISTTRYGIL